MSEHKERSESTSTEAPSVSKYKPVERIEFVPRRAASTREHRVSSSECAPSRRSITSQARHPGRTNLGSGFCQVQRLPRQISKQTIFPRLQNRARSIVEISLCIYWSYSRCQCSHDETFKLSWKRLSTADRRYAGTPKEMLGFWRGSEKKTRAIP